MVLESSMIYPKRGVSFDDSASICHGLTPLFVSQIKSQLLQLCCPFPGASLIVGMDRESQNGLGRDLKDDLIPTPNGAEMGEGKSSLL